MTDLPSFRVSGQSSGICRHAYGPAYGYPTHKLAEARIDAQRMADVLHERVTVLNDALVVVETVAPRPLNPRNDIVSKAKPCPPTT